MATLYLKYAKKCKKILGGGMASFGQEVATPMDRGPLLEDI